MPNHVSLTSGTYIIWSGRGRKTINSKFPIMSLRCSQKTLSLGVGTNCVRSCCMEAERRSWEFLICWMLYTLWPCQSHPLWSGNWTFYCFSVNYRYVVLVNGFLALFVAIWLERLRRFWSLNPAATRRCLANISGLRRLFCRFSCLPWHDREQRDEKERSREFPICSADRFQFLFLKTKKKYFAISWMLVIAPLAREKETGEIC